MPQAALRYVEENQAPETLHQDQLEADMDSIHVLPLSIVPLKTPSLRRARLIKNVRLESVVELFSDIGGASGQLDPTMLADTFDWPRAGLHPDERTIIALSELHSFDVYSLRLQLRKLGIQITDSSQLRLSHKKSAELMQYMNEFTLPLLRQIYDSSDKAATDMDGLVKKFTVPDRQEALQNLKVIADRLAIGLHEVPRFLEEYADIYMSISYGKEILRTLVPKIAVLQDDMDEIKENYELRNDARLMQSIDFIRKSIQDLTESVAGRFETFDKSSKKMWEEISPESFKRVKRLVRSHHASIGAVLCGLSVKLNGWQDNMAKGRGLIRRADFLRSDMLHGMEKITTLDRDLVQQQEGPAWESFTV